MKIFLFESIFIFFICFITVIFGAPNNSPNGFGTVITVSTNSSEIKIQDNGENSFATFASIYNLGTNIIFCAVNCSSTSTFENVVSKNQAVPISESQIFTFQAPNRQISSVWLKTTNGTSTVMIGAY